MHAAQRQRWRRAAAADGSFGGNGEHPGLQSAGPLDQSLTDTSPPADTQQLEDSVRQQAGIQPPSAAVQQQQQEEQQEDQEDGPAAQQRGRWQRHLPRWQLPAVPWELNTTIVLMGVWGVWFTFAAHTLVPTLLQWAGVQLSSSSASQALRHLALDTLQVRMGLVLSFRRSDRHVPPAPAHRGLM